MVGIRVRESKYEAIMAKTTRHGERGEQVLGGARQQQHGDEDDADGRGWRRRPARQSARRHRARRAPAALRMAMLRCVFSISTVASSTRMPTASARPPSVITLIVCPSRFSMIIDVRIDSGIEMQTITVLRQLPRNSRIIRPVSMRRDHAFADHAVDGGAHEERLVEKLFYLERGRQTGQDLGQRGLHVVDHRQCGCLAVAQDREQGAAAARSCAPTLVCTEYPSRTCATSLR